MKHYKLSAALVTIGLTLMCCSGTLFAGEHDVIQFSLVPNPQFVDCLAAYPGDLHRLPTADVTVVRGKLNDVLFLRLRNIKPGLAFDLFTVQRSNLLANGLPDPDLVGKVKNLAASCEASGLPNQPER